MQAVTQVCTFEQSKRLAQHGITLDSYFQWYVGRYKTTNEIQPERLDHINSFDRRKYHVEIYPAYTVAELGLLLPEEIPGIDFFYELHQFQFCEKGFIVDFRLLYQSNRDKSVRIPQERRPIAAKTEAQARAEMLLYLLDNHIVYPDWVQRRCQFSK